VYSQPADTGTGNNVNTQLVYAVNHLKVNRSLEQKGFCIFVNEELGIYLIVNAESNAASRLGYCNEYTAGHRYCPARKVQGS
jgi:hypothetical protein